jgi:hypothetical protein
MKGTTMKRCRNIIWYILLCLFLGNGISLADEPNENNIIPAVRESLKNAGIGLDDKSLIEALNNNDKYLACAAALALRAHKKTAEIVYALTNAATDDHETLALIAMNVLHELGDESWISLGRTRMFRFKDPHAQVMLAQLMAKAGDGVGWEIVANALTDERLCPIALESIESFNNRAKSNGEIINVKEELRKIILIAPEKSRERISRKLGEK